MTSRRVDRLQRFISKAVRNWIEVEHDVFTDGEAFMQMPSHPGNNPDAVEWYFEMVDGLRYQITLQVIYPNHENQKETSR